MAKVFIDGSSGTTGLRIRERLQARKDIEIISLPEELRKDNSAKKDAIAMADIAFFCLPDEAAIETAELAAELDTVIIDTSTAHRVNDGWAYGFPEIHGQRQKIVSSGRIANPGCHASGFIALIAPLVKEGKISPELNLSAFSVTGYSGGGKKMIADYEGREIKGADLLGAPRMYGITQMHKHLPEMVALCGLKKSPVFCPIVADYYAGMEVTVPLFPEDSGLSVKEIEDIYASYYGEGLVKFVKGSDENGFLSAGALAGRDDMEISVFGNDERILLVSRFDNLGKGASGAAIQNMNIKLGIDEKTGLNV